MKKRLCALTLFIGQHRIMGQKIRRSPQGPLCCVAIVLLLSLAGPVLQVRAQASTPPEPSEGVQNIVKRAYQMVNIQWTPLADIEGWGSSLTYKAGTTYTGLPYGQPVYASYVPWSTDLDGFLTAVNTTGSKMYTSYSSYNRRAPYYSTDCSAFVSWAWGLSSRQTTQSISVFANEISRTSYADAQVGDCLCLASSHTVLITDITYDSAGSIASIEIAEAAVNSAANHCCHTTRYGAGGSASLSQFTAKYFDKGYILYRSKTRDSVTYTHSCAVPLEGDHCDLCGVGTPCSHDYRCGILASPGCTSNGSGVYTCILCGDSYTGVIPATGHTEVTDAAVAPTCTGSGLTEGKHCTVCGRRTTPQQIIPATGHTPVTVPGKDATCTEAGLSEGAFCSVCDALLAEAEEIQPLGHCEMTDPAVAPTCTEAGLTEGKHCSACGEILIAPEPVSPSGHSWRDNKCEFCGAEILVPTTPMYRLYNPNTGEHFYTGSEQERDDLTDVGWNYEGIAWNAPITGGAPVYRVYNPNSGDHHYTMSMEEVDNLVALGWKYEGVAWNSAAPGNIPQYRLYNPNADIGSHHYTSSEEERDFLTSLGWILEGIGWYSCSK